MTEEEQELDLSELSPAQSRLLNEAFDRVFSEQQQKSTKTKGHSSSKKDKDGRDTKRRRVEENSPTTGSAGGSDAGGGGFVVDEEQDFGGGGFLMDTDDGGGGFLSADGEGGGGFVLDENDDGGGGGGFFVSDEEPMHEAGGFEVDPTLSSASPPSPSNEQLNETQLSSATHIPLSLIPKALKLCRLPPATDVLQFFREYAVYPPGTSGRTINKTTGQPPEKVVSRKDWLSVCAILMADRGEDVELDVDQEDDEEEEQPVRRPRRKPAADVEMNVDEDDDEPLEFESVGSEEEGGGFEPFDEADDDDDDYSNLQRTASTRRRTRTSGPAEPLTSPLSSDDEAFLPTSDEEAMHSKASTKKSKKKQKRYALAEGEELILQPFEKMVVEEAFALFFPGLGVEELKKQNRTLGVTEVTKAVSVLNEDLGLSEVKEMITTFSSHPSKLSLTFKDFEKLMWEGGLL